MCYSPLDYPPLVTPRTLFYCFTVLLYLRPCDERYRGVNWFGMTLFLVCLCRASLYLVNSKSLRHSYWFSLDRAVPNPCQTAQQSFTFGRQKARTRETMLLFSSPQLNSLCIFLYHPSHSHSHSHLYANVFVARIHTKFRTGDFVLMQIQS